MPPTGLMFCVCFPSLFPWWPPFQPKLGASMPRWPRVIIFPCPSGSVHVHPVCTIDSCQFCQADSTLQPWFWKQTWPDIPSWTSSSRSRCIKIMGQCVQSVSDIQEIHPPDLPQFGRFRLSKNPEKSLNTYWNMCTAHGEVSHIVKRKGLTLHLLPIAKSVPSAWNHWMIAVSAILVATWICWAHSKHDFPIHHVRNPMAMPKIRHG